MRHLRMQAPTVPEMAMAMPVMWSNGWQLRGMRRLATGMIRAIYPPQCVHCGGQVASDFGLCGPCWRETAFISGPVCSLCGVPIQTAPLSGAGAVTDICDDCHLLPRPWQAGRAAMLYEGAARKMVLALKHGDRMELARPMGQWLAFAAAPLLQPRMLVLPIPLHWTRLFLRRYNQAALLSAALSQHTGLRHCPDALRRLRHTSSQEGRSRAARFEALEGAFRIHPGRIPQIRDHPVLLVDDVMTSGATFSHASMACLAAGATSVSILALARVAKDA